VLKTMCGIDCHKKRSTVPNKFLIKRICKCCRGTWLNFRPKVHNALPRTGSEGLVNSRSSEGSIFFDEASQAARMLSLIVSKQHIRCLFAAAG
jgi:hypothetical protein